MRRAILIAILGVALMAPASASATTNSATAGGVEATLSYSGGPGITTKNERLTIELNGKVVYDEKVPSKSCFEVCSPSDKNPVHVVDLYADGSEDVVLDLFSGGADCCTIEAVYVPSAAVNSYVLDEHSFGEGGASIENIGPKGRPEFVSQNSIFYCEFTDCAASGMPLQILEFSGERFVDVTKQHPNLIAADARNLLKLYQQHLADGNGLIAAWAGDEDNLGLEATVRTVLQAQVADGHLKAAFVTTLQNFLKKHSYA